MREKLTCCPPAQQLVVWRAIVIAMIGMVSAVCCGCGSGVYSSSSWLRIEHEPHYILVPRTGAQTDLKQYGEDLRALVLSPLVLEQVLARVDIARIDEIYDSSRPVELLLKHLKFEQLGNSETWVLTCEWSDPEEAALIANATVESAFRMLTQDDAQRQSRLVDLKEDELSRQKAMLEQQAEQVRELEVKLVETEADLRARALRDETLRASYLHLRQQQDEVSLKLAELKVSSVTAKESAAEPSAEQTALERRSQAIVTRQAEVLQELTNFAHSQPLNPDLKAKRAELQSTQDIVDKLAQHIRQLRLEMTAPARVTLLRKAEPSHAPE